MPDPQRQRLRQLIFDTGALQYGEFTLSSGAKSSYYLDGRKVTFHPEGALLIGRLFFQALQGTGAEAVGGPTMGADPIATAVVLVSQMAGKPLFAFAVRKEQKQHGTGKLIEGSLPEGRRLKVAVVEDTVSTGASLMQAIGAVEEEGHTVVQVLAVVDRCQGGSEMLQKKGYSFMALFQLDSQGRLSE
jgi:orotate phosphoribosyltransferase